MKTRVALSFLSALCLTAATAAFAQQNVYIDKTVDGYNRVHIVSHVDSIHYGPDTTMTFWSGTNATSFNTPDVTLMSFREKDPWRAKAFPTQYLDDFNFDITFEESDKDSVVAEPEVTDVNSPLYEDFPAHSTWSKTVYVVYADTCVTVTGDTDSLSVSKVGAHLTINTTAVGVRYILSGTGQDAFFKLYSGKKASLVLNGLNLTNPHGPVINSQLKKRLFLELPANTVNTLTDGSSYTKTAGEDQRGCIFAEGQICISGQGELYVNANKKCGIASDDYIHQMGGFVHVNAHATKGKAVYGKDNVIIGGGVLRTCSDGAASKGITSDSLMTISGGMVKTITTGDAVFDNAEQDYSSCCGIKSNWGMTITDASIYCLSTGIGGKGISAGNYVETTGTDGKTKKYYNGGLTITNSNIYVRTSGVRIPLEKVEDHGKKVGPSASPKCIKSIHDMTINSSNIYVRGSGGEAAEGIESKKHVTVNGAKIRSYCVDDGLNASGCVINSGDVFICSSENDGLDAGYLKMFAGSLYAIGGWSQQMGIDTDGKTFEFQNGCHIIGVGSRSCTPHGTSTQNSICFYLKNRYCSHVALTDSVGNVITSFPTPDTYPILCLFVASPALTVGEHYQILSYQHSLSDVPVVEYDFVLTDQFITLGSK